MKKYLFIFAALLSLINGVAQTQPISAKQIDSLTELVLKTFNVPGIAVGVVKDGKLIHAKGYGVYGTANGQLGADYRRICRASDDEPYYLLSEVEIDYRAYSRGFHTRNPHQTRRTTDRQRRV